MAFREFRTRWVSYLRLSQSIFKWKSDKLPPRCRETGRNGFYFFTLFDGFWFHTSRDRGEIGFVSHDCVGRALSVSSHDLLLINTLVCRVIAAALVIYRYLAPRFYRFSILCTWLLNTENETISAIAERMCLLVLFFRSLSLSSTEYMQKKQWRTEINSHDSIENEIHIAIFTLQLHVRRQDDKKNNKKWKWRLAEVYCSSPEKTHAVDANKAAANRL